MATIVPELTLNKTPNDAKPNSLIFAKNIRIDPDKTIHKDYGLKSIVNDNTLLKEYLVSGKYIVCGVIPHNNEFYIFIYNKDINDSKIIKYDELSNEATNCNTGWIYSGGTIDGNVIKNLVGDTLLIIGENNANTNVPLKTINLNHSKTSDDETIYTQAPHIPLINLDYAGDCQRTIPNGVYQFFIRYRIKEGFYTNWFPASKDLFACNTNYINTNFGSLKYNNINTDSDNSFVFNINILNPEYISNYKDFQIGFILSHDNEIVARSWKHFNFDVTEIYFDYQVNDIKEINIHELTRNTFQLYNVGNVTTFKDKTYVSNYTETDANEDLTEYAKQVQIDIKEAPIVINSESNPTNPNISFDYENDIDNDNIPKAFYNYVKYDIRQNTKFIHSVRVGNRYIPVGELIQNAFNDSDLWSMIHSAFKYMGDEVKFPTGVINANGFTFNITGTSALNATKAIDEAIRKLSVSIHTSGSYSTYTNPVEVKKYEKYKLTNDKGKQITVNIKTSILEAIRNGGIYSFGNNNIIQYYRDKNLSTENNYLGYKKYFDSSDVSINNIDDLPKLDTYIKNNLKYIHLRIAKKQQGDVLTAKTYTVYSAFDNGDYEDNFIGIELDLARAFQLKYEVEEFTGNNGNINVVESAKFDIKIEAPTSLEDLVKYANSNSSSDNTPTLSINDEYTNNQTLIPYQQYNFYVHYIKNTGESTNGYLCDTRTIGYKSICNNIIYPSFSNITIPDGYVGCYFSISHINERVATIFNIEKSDILGQEGSCAELNMRLLPYNKNIKCKYDDKDFNAKYYYSADTAISKFFGADGVVVIDDITTDMSNKLVYIVDKFSKQLTESETLIKCTPFINTETYDNPKQLNLLGFICKYYPLNKERTINYYSDGSSVYKKKFDSVLGDSKNTIINFKELSKYSDGEEKVKDFSITDSAPLLIYSSYNLNCVALSEEPKIAIKTYYDYASNDTGSQHTENQTHNIAWRLLTSLNMAEVYELPAMYIEYTRKPYSKYDADNNYTTFNNTIRSSKLEGDESKYYIVKFLAEDYYNVPVDKGTITNLVAIGDSILVHTKDSIYRFVGSNNLNATSGDVAVIESQPFDTGIREIFGSEYGFGGLRLKTDQMVSEQGYFYYDRDAKVIFAYSGNNQMVKISDKINKLFKQSEVKNISFASDFYNNRFFICLAFADNRYATLSYNTQDDVKAFVSLHDFKFKKSFNTKVNCYFINDSDNNIYTIDRDNYSNYNELAFTDTLYPQKELQDSVYYSIVDVIINPQIENIKTLDSVSWCARSIKESYPVITDEPETLLVAEELVKYKPCRFMRIYSDTCSTDLCDFSKDPDSANISNEYRLNQLESYKLPRYNQGVWTYNYFRNILNVNNNFNYLKTANNYRNGADYIDDQNSLIEGRYFVVRFLFDDEFKLENIKCNIKNKIIS